MLAYSSQFQRPLTCTTQPSFGIPTQPPPAAAMATPVPGILPYTLIKVNDTPTLAFLLWRDRRSTATESSTFWGPVVCPLGKEDKSPLDAVCRVFSEKTKGQFAPAVMTYDNEHDLEAVARKSPPKQRIEESRLTLRKKLRAGVGVTLLCVRQFVTYVAPVRFVPPEKMAAAFGAEKGEAEWVSAKDLFAALYSSVPDNAVAVRGQPFDSNTAAPAAGARSVALPLVLPFTALMRTAEAKSELAAILKQFNVELPAPVDHQALADAVAADAETGSAAAAAVPDVASLSLHNESGASANAAAASAAAASAPAPAAAAAASGPRPSVNYTCRKCRTVLFTDLSLVDHVPASVSAAGRFAHKHVRVAEGGRRVGVECSSLFVEPSALGDFAGSEGEGPLQCPKCATRYGGFHWSGAQCSCGQWVSPAFQAVKSKVDERAAAQQRDTRNHIAFSFQKPPPREPAAAEAAGSEAAAAGDKAPAAANATT